MVIPIRSNNAFPNETSGFRLDTAVQRRHLDGAISCKSVSRKPSTGPCRPGKRPPREKPGCRGNRSENVIVAKAMAIGRSGVSLIEVMVVITFLTLLMSLTGMTFHLLFRSEKLVTQSFVTERAISQLSIQFRNDVHLSESGVVTSDSAAETAELLLSLPDGLTIHYLAKRAALIRLQKEGERIVTREDYRLTDCRPVLLAGPDSDVSLRTLLIARPGATIVQKEHQPLPLRSLRIEARLNRLSGNRSTRSNDGTQASPETTEDHR